MSDGPGPGLAPGDPNPAFRTAGGRLAALRSPPVGGPRIARRGALVILALFAVAVFATYPRTSGTSLDAVGPLPPGVSVAKEVGWCRGDGWRDRTCSAVGFLRGEDAAGRMAGSLTASGWRDTGGGLWFRDGTYVRLGSVSAARYGTQKVLLERSRALAAQPPATAELVVYAWSPV